MTADRNALEFYDRSIRCISSPRSVRCECLHSQNSVKKLMELVFCDLNIHVIIDINTTLIGVSLCYYMLSLPSVLFAWTLFCNICRYLEFLDYSSKKSGVTSLSEVKGTTKLPHIASNVYIRLPQWKENVPILALKLYVVTSRVQPAIYSSVTRFVTYYF